MTMNTKEEHLVADILVVGSGIAGLAAAIAAKDANPNAEVLVVDKCVPGKGGKANKGGGNLAFLAPEDDVEKFMRFRVEKVGCYLEDQAVLREFITSAHGILGRSETWGVTVYHEPDGSFTYVRWAEDMPWRMALCEQDVTEQMQRHARQQGTKFLDHISIVDLLKDGERVAGAYGFSVLDGTAYTIQSKTVILANGNQNYRLMRRWASGRGDGIAAAYRAGAEMRNAEFGSFHNWVFADTKEVCQGAEDCLYNAKGEHITKAIRPAIEADLHPKEIVAWWKEIKAGNGPVRANMAENYISNVTSQMFHTDSKVKRPLTTAFWSRTISKAMAGSKHPGPMQEVHPGFIGEQSPVKVDPKMATTIPGLFAAGDLCASGSGWSGAVPAPPGRLRGGGLMFALWSGLKSGESAAKDAAAARAPQLNAAEVAAIKQRVFAPLEAKDGVEPMELVRAIQTVMAPIGNTTCKSEERLKAALEKILEIAKRLPNLKAKDWHYLAACNEVRSMVLCAEMFFRASLERKETRGWHIREDYPERDDRNLRKWFTLKDVNGKMTVASEPLPLPPGAISP